MLGFVLQLGALLGVVQSQCFLQELTTTQSNGIQLHDNDIDLNTEIVGFITLTSLLKQENFMINKNFIITSPDDYTCIFLGHGMRLHDIQSSLTDTPNLPLLTQATVLSNTKILLTTTQITTIVSKKEFTQLVTILGFEDQVSMTGHKNIVFILEGSRKILTNFNHQDTNICETSPTVLNLGHRLSRLITEMSVVWTKLQKANLLYGKVMDLEGFSKCLDVTQITFKELMIVSLDNLEFCKKGLMKRTARSISVGSFLLGEGSTIMELQTSLHKTIQHFNENFKSMENFDNSLVASLSSIEDDIMKISNEELNLHDGFLQLKQELDFTKNHFHYLNLKEQHIQALEDILVKSDLHENLILLERALFNNNICTFLNCETKIFAIREGTVIRIHTEVLELTPSQKQLITCQAKSATHVSTWHNQLAALSGDDTLVLKDKMIHITHLKNESYVNQELRFLSQDEILLGVFHLFDKKKLQCLAKVEFLLNQQQTSCFALQTMQLSGDFQIEHQGSKISEEHTISHINMVASSWMNEYNFDNLPKSILQEGTESQAVFHPILDSLILSPAGQISIEKVSLLTAGTVIFFLLCCAGCLYKFKGFRTCLWNTGVTTVSKIYNCATTKSHRTKRENKLLKKEMASQKQKIRENISDLQLMSQLEKSLANTTQRSSLPNISQSVQIENNSMKPQIEMEHLGAHGGTQWHQLSVIEEPVTDVADLHQLGEGGGRDWKQLKRLGKPVVHSVMHQKRRPE